MVIHVERSVILIVSQIFVLLYVQVDIRILLTAFYHKPNLSLSVSLGGN